MSTPKAIPLFPGLEGQRVPGLPPVAYYIRDFISPDEEDLLLRKIAETPQPKWKKVGSGRRLQYWGGTLSKNNVLLPEPMPDWLSSFPNIIERVDAFLDATSEYKEIRGKGKERALGVNQVLINEYTSGQGISPHEDGPAFLPLVTTLSLGSPTVLDLYHYISANPSPPMIPTEGKTIAAVPLGHLLLMPRSLLVLTGSLYESHLHGISERTRDVVVSTELAPTASGRTAPVPDPTSEAGDATTNNTASLTRTDGVAASAPTAEDPEAETAEADSQPEEPPVVITNAALIGGAVGKALEKGTYAYDRGTRTSLTFRRAQRVLKGGAFAMAAGGLRRS